jgi:CMP-N-acetylneuraminic acid synthetase
MGCSADQLYDGPHRVLMVPEERALDIDTLHDFQAGEALLQAGMLQLPWCEEVHAVVLERS